MTYADEEFIPAEGQEETPNYPTVFGITFTPTIGGLIIGVVGLGLAGYLAVTQVQPVWEKYQELENTVKEKESQVEQQQAIQKQIKETEAKLEQAKQQNKQVLSLFANEKSLDTLLLDLNTFVKARNGTLTSYTPAQDAANGQSGATDASQATLANGKLKSQSVDVQLEGNFNQIQSILRSFERLQSLLVVKDFKAEVSEAQALLFGQGKVVPALIKENNKVLPGAQPILKTTFKLQVLVPVTEEESKAAPAAAAQPAQQ